MPDILVRGLSAAKLKRLKARAKQHGRSLQSEAKTILENAAGAGPREIAAMLGQWQRQFKGREFSDSATLIREDRER